ncbi:MAG TPA: hypothetical protein VIF63_08145 [Candidatus Limnocylindrales bacterium]|jgi:hypothetical protein
MSLHIPIQRARAALALAFLALPAILASPAITLADCMMPPPIEEAVKSAEIVFLGTVTNTANRDSWATVEIEEVWVGPDMPAEVLIKGGPGGNAATSVDRSFQVGLKYLFFPYIDEGGEVRPGEVPELAGGLADNSCTSTQQWSPELEALRPADVRAPLGSSTTPEAGIDIDLGGILGPIVAGVVVASVLLGIGLLARGRQTT